MLEADARKRWCPFASSRMLTIPDPRKRGDVIIRHFATTEDGMPGTTCIGHQCMAWRDDGIPEKPDAGDCLLMNRGTSYG